MYYIVFQTSIASTALLELELKRVSAHQSWGFVPGALLELELIRRGHQSWGFVPNYNKRYVFFWVLCRACDRVQVEVKACV